MYDSTEYPPLVTSKMKGNLKTIFNFQRILQSFWKIFAFQTTQKVKEIRQIILDHRTQYKFIA